MARGKLGSGCINGLVDGQEVTPELVSKKCRNGPLLDDHYHEWPIRELRPGRHTATVVRVFETGKNISREIEFAGQV